MDTEDTAEKTAPSVVRSVAPAKPAPKPRPADPEPEEPVPSVPLSGLGHDSCNRCIVADLSCNSEACSLDAPGVVTPDTAPDISEPN